MTTNKLAPAKDWRNRPIETWTVLSFTEYLRDTHKERFGIDYAPMRSWGIEQGMLGDLIAEDIPMLLTEVERLRKALVEIADIEDWDYGLEHAKNITFKSIGEPKGWDGNDNE